jgi:hypothetical protein
MNVGNIGPLRDLEHLASLRMSRRLHERPGGSRDGMRRQQLIRYGGVPGFDEVYKSWENAEKA